MGGHSWLIALIVLIVFQAGAAADENGFYVRATAGLAYQPLNDWNDDVKADEQVFRSAGLPLNFERFGLGVPISAEAGYNINRALSVGLESSYQDASAGTAYSDISGSFSTHSDLSILSVTSTVCYALHRYQELFVSAEVGIGFVKARSEEHFRYIQDPSYDFDGLGKWTGHAPVIGISLGCQRDFPTGGLIFSELGYRYQNAGKLDGQFTSPQFGSQTGPPVNNSGQAMNTDFSCIYVRIGVGFQFKK